MGVARNVLFRRDRRVNMMGAHSAVASRKPAVWDFVLWRNNLGQTLVEEEPTSAAVAIVATPELETVAASTDSEAEPSPPSPTSSLSETPRVR